MPIILFDEMENNGQMNKLPQLLREAGSTAFFSVTGLSLWGVHFHINQMLTRQGKTVLTVTKEAAGQLKRTKTLFLWDIWKWSLQDNIYL